MIDEAGSSASHAHELLPAPADGWLEEEVVQLDGWLEKEVVELDGWLEEEEVVELLLPADGSSEEGAAGVARDAAVVQDGRGRCRAHLVVINCILI